jgi:hypothetical protein
MNISRIICIFFLIISLCLNSAVYAKNRKLPVDGKGYVGTLPEVTRDYGKTGASEDDEQEAKSVKPIESKDFNSENEIKPAPKDDPAFVNIILKTDKTSKYANDLNEFITMLENLYDVMEENANVQLFNAKVYYFNRNVDDFRDRYAGKPESSYVSYKRLLELSAHTQSIALLRTEAEKYNPYLSYGSAGYIYNPNNIQEQLGFLKTEIQQTIILLRDSL